MQKLFDLSGKKALVTGGSVGVGRACATALAMAGADVAIVARTASRGERCCDGLRRLGVDAVFIRGDVTDPHQTRSIHDQALQRFGRVDIAVNNAGAGIARSALETSDSEWDSMISLNLSSVFYSAQAQAKQMTQQTPKGGKIINIGSMYAAIAGGHCAYNAAKAGVVHLTRSLAYEWGSWNINVNCISPGWMLTPGNPIDASLRKRLREVTPVGSLMKYSDIFGPIVFLASEASDFVTGHNLTIDGGHTVNTHWLPLKRNVPPRNSTEDEELGFIEDEADR
jgi:NAD(P)-dependent dehydrogenase (short-subunit alcohol dehydrogenase family)